jgi:uracil-DNA glycosylase family 4
MATNNDTPLTISELLKLPREKRLGHYGKRYLVPIEHQRVPAAGPDFARIAAQLGGEKIVPKLPRDHPVEAALDYLYRSALYKRNSQLQIAFKGQFKSVAILPGGFWILPPIFNELNSTQDVREWQWADYARVNGPRKTANVMLIGKHPGVEELDHEQNFIGPSSSDLHRALREIGVTQDMRDSWYVTNTVKHNRLDPTSGTMQQSWLKNCAPLLWEEILLVRPKFIACLGSEAIKAVLGKSYTVTNMAGRVEYLTLHVPPADAVTHEDYDDLDTYVEHKIVVVGIPHPAYIFRQPEAYPDLLSGLEKFVEMAAGERQPEVEDKHSHTPYYSAENLGKRVDDILEKAHAEWDFEVDGDLPVAWDAEWHGRQPGDAGSYLRTIQFSVGRNYDDAPRKASAIVLTEKGGGTGWFNTRSEITNVIRRLIEGRHSNASKYPRIGTRHGGHFFKADIPWIREFTGIDFRSIWIPPQPLPPGIRVERFDGHRYRKELAAVIAYDKTAPADRKGPRPPEPDRADKSFIREHEPYELTRYTGGFDTGYMTHAVFEAMESFNLEHLAMRWTTCPRWDGPVEQAKVQIAKEMGIKMKELVGYGDIPDEVLLPYALYDADATLRLFWRFNYKRGPGEGEGFLDQDVKHNSSREAFWRTMLAGPAFLEMEETGVTVDVARGKELIQVFELVKERLTESLRDELGWPNFNPNSAPQVRALLFGEKYSGLVDKKTGTNKRQLPASYKEIGLGLTPIKTTGKPSKSWGQIQSKDPDGKIYTPAVDKEVLGIYAWTHGAIKKLRDIRYVRQVLQSVLRPPKPGEVIGADAEGAVYDESDEFDGGFLSYVNTRDSRVRSRFYPVETGRCSSAAPNLQNLAKRREDDYARILGRLDDNGQSVGDYLAILGAPLYHDPIRSIVTAGMWDGEPTVLMEFDIISAEIAALAWESGDATMIDDVNRAMLPEDDPNFLDIHSSTAVEAFKLTCPPTKKGLKAIGKPGLRVAAKNVRFGVPYGRSAEALSRQCREEGADVSVKECQSLIDSYHKRYAWASDFLTECEERPAGKGYLVGAFGRMRRFGKVDDPSALADQGRSAKNYPIQNLVADYILMSMYNLLKIREDRGLQNAFRLVLQIHDALMLEVKIPYIEMVDKEVIPAAMTDGIPIMPRTLDGMPFDDPKILNTEYRAQHITEPYRFKVDSSVFLNWGQSIEPARGKALGIPEEYLRGH